MFARNIGAKIAATRHTASPQSCAEKIAARGLSPQELRRRKKEIRVPGAADAPSSQAIALRKRAQSKFGPGSVLRAGAMSQWPTMSSIG